MGRAPIPFSGILASEEGVLTEGHADPPFVWGEEGRTGAPL